MRIHRQLAPLLCSMVAAVIMFPAARAAAQTSDSGVVTGHVYCADTQKPARFANIRLQPVDEGQGSRGGRGGFAITGSDGSFRITNVASGEYYADVIMPGYIQPLRSLSRNLQSLSQAERDHITAELTRISVGTNQSANVQVTIYRGATISGTVSYDDGGPAPGISIQAYVLTSNSTGTQTAGSGTQQSFAGFAQTDDRGQFRVPGLSDGTYIVFAAPRSVFPIYYGNTIARSDAKKIDVHAGDDVQGTDIQIPAIGMHRVSGVVVSQQDNHPIARASVQLRLSSGDGNAISALSGPDGSFAFNAVPDGKFTVMISSAYDASATGGYTSAGQALEVNGGDVSDLVVNVTPRN